jgi:hypothetical protein
MVEKHNTTTEWFRLLLSVFLGVSVGLLVSQTETSLFVVVAVTSISVGVMLGLLRAYDP